MCSISKLSCRETLAPRQPWGLVLYADEVVPGAQLAHRNDRTFSVIYASVMEFGTVTLSNEHAWITLGQIRTNQVENVVSGMSQVFGALLRSIFVDRSIPAVLECI